MDCTFSVSLDDLRQVATKLSAISADLTTLGDVRADYDAILGSNDVRQEVHAFFRHWSDGMHSIGDHVKDLADHVHGAVAAYEQNENALIAQATPAR